MQEWKTGNGAMVFLCFVALYESRAYAMRILYVLLHIKYKIRTTMGNGIVEMAQKKKNKMKYEKGKRPHR